MTDHDHIQQELPPMPEAFGEIAYWRQTGYVGHVSGFTRNQMRAYAEAAIAAALRSQGAQAVPEGWQLVPIEATPEMETANAMYGDTSDWWNTVLTAAPKPEGW